MLRPQLVKIFITITVTITQTSIHIYRITIFSFGDQHTLFHHKNIQKLLCNLLFITQKTFKWVN